MEDITAPKFIEITIREDGAVIWVNDEGKCLFRACQVTALKVNDLRSKAVKEKQSNLYENVMLT